MGWVAPAQWFGHASGDVTPPPLCTTPAAIGSWLLWLDPTLSPGLPHAHLTSLQFARSSAAASFTRVRPPRHIFYVAKLRRRKAQEVFILETLSRVTEAAESTANETSFHGMVDLSLQPDVGEFLALAAPCNEIPAAAVDAAHYSTGSTITMPGLAFTLASNASVEPGLVVALQDAVASLPPAWAFGYVPRTRSAVDTAARNGGALEVLVRVRDDAKCIGEHVLLERVRVFSRQCSWVLRYPLYVLHTGNLEGVNLQELLAWMDDVRSAAHPELSVRFLDISDEFSQVRFGSGIVTLGDLDLMWMDLTSPRSRRIRELKPRRFKAGYRHMCRFHSSTLLELPMFAGTRYLMHFDEDAALLCRPGSAGVDPIQEMARSSSVYGLFEVGIEDPVYMEGWTGFLEEYVLLHEVRPPVPLELLSSRDSFLTKEDDEHPGRLVNVTPGRFSITWGTAWEVLDLDFFLSPQVLEFSQKVERSLGHYRHSWGDHLVRAYQVQLFAPHSRIRCFEAEELPGIHGCNGYERGTGDEFVYQFIRDLACPGQWTTEWLRDVPWLPAENSPRPCLARCNELNCEGFDIVWFGDGSMAHCILRDGRSGPEVCLGGGVRGPAGAAWAHTGVDLAGVTLLGSANRFGLLERTINRTMNCSRWRAELAARLAGA